jgi:hypothetical protein
MKKYIITLTEDERDSLGILASKENHKSQKVFSALILLGRDKRERQATCLRVYSLRQRRRYARLCPTLNG